MQHAASPSIEKRTHVAAIVVETRIPEGSELSQEKLQYALEEIIVAIYPNTEAVGFKVVATEANGHNEIIVHTRLNKNTCAQIEQTLERLFTQLFNIRSTSTDETLNRKVAVLEAFHKVFAHFNNEN